MKWRHVWRVETSEGVGAYHNGHAKAMDDVAMEINGAAPSLYSHPGPGDRAELGTPLAEAFKGYSLLTPHSPEAAEYIFGFASLAQYRTWFWAPEHRNIGNVRGLKLVRFRVPAHDVVDGQHQLAFRRRSALVVDVRPL